MRGVVLEGPRDIRVINREDPKIIDPTDAVIRITATCICGSDLWPYRGEDHSEHLMSSAATSTNERSASSSGHQQRLQRPENHSYCV